MNMVKRYQCAEQQLAWQVSLPACGSSEADLKAEAGIASANQASRQFFVRDNNLWLYEISSQEEYALTTDGQPDYGYGTYPSFLVHGICENQSLAPAVVLSPDGRYLAVQRIDERDVVTMPLMKSVPQQGLVRPADQGYKMALPGDEHLPMATLVIIDLNTRSVTVNNRPPVAASNGGLVEAGRVFWDKDNRLYSIEQSRDRRAITFVQIDPQSGSGRVLLEEQADTYIQLGPLPFSEPLVCILPTRKAFIWYSQKTGWGHLYLHDLITGQLIDVLTAGEFVVTQLYAVDEAAGVVYFNACGRENNSNPYYEYLYRTNLDGSDLMLLTPENAQHDISDLCLEKKTFIDTCSRVDLPTQQVVRHLDDGAIIGVLVDVDASQTAAKGFNHPVIFIAKAEDHITDLYGVLYRPPDFDPKKTYPVILAVYGTPHECIVPTRYAETSAKVRDIYRTLAELGFIVVMMDPSGTPLRGKAFHDLAYRNLQNGGGIDDQVAVLKQLGERHSWIDINRVGITGHSGGGYASARAMMSHPDFFKVCVSSAGNHDQRLYVAGWAETFQGLVDGDNYEVFNNDHLIKNLKGKLLLVHGDADANVHIAHTIQLVDKLINHNKDFDLLVLPNRGHLHAQDTYFIRRVWDYFVEHLLGEKPPKEYTITSPEAPAAN